MQKSDIKIVIIGAGAAGLAAGIKLTEYGYENLTILEVEDQIGGRIKSTNYHNSIIDEGAQWCHGEDGNIVYEMVKDLNMLQTSKNDYKDNQFYNYKGERIDKSFADRLHDTLMVIATDTEGLLNTKYPLGDYILERYNAEIIKLNLNEDEMKIARLMPDWFCKRLLITSAALNWNDISSPLLTTYKECEGDQLLNWKNKGYFAFLNILMKRKDGLSILDDKILLNQKVDKICWNDSIEIHCNNGDIYKADHVIFTPSMGVLKATHDTMFAPQLPSDKIQAIEAVGFGAIGKLLLKFPCKWWGDAKSICFIYNEQDREDLVNEFKDDPIKDGKSWLEYILGVFVTDGNETVLLVWLVGELIEMMELLSDQKIIRGITFLLNKFLSQKFNIAPIEDILHTKWITNNNFRGTYSYRSVKYEHENIQDNSLSDPICNANQKPVIQFAGEGTHPYFYSTVHGAVETGFREAKRIADYYK